MEAMSVLESWGCRKTSAAYWPIEEMQLVNQCNRRGVNDKKKGYVERIPSIPQMNVLIKIERRLRYT